MVRFRRVASMAALLGAAGCASLAGLDESYELDPGPGSGGAGGAGGKSGASGVGGGSGGVGGAGASGGGGDGGASAAGGVGAAGNGGASGAGAGGSGAGGVGGAGPGGAGPGGAAGSPSSCAVGCPEGLEGPPMVRVGSGAGAFCMDAREVTNEEYARFLATNPSIVQPIIACQAGNLSFTPAAWPAPAAKSGHPVAGVDWCDSWGYCRWAGKRLCGKVGGGALTTAEALDAARSQWMAACSAGGSREYPYGTPYDPSACNGADRGVGTTLPGFAATACFAQCDRLFDLSGNVAEWEDACGVGNTVCRVRGGSFADGGAALSCAASRTEPHLFASPHVGFRCCTD